MRKEKRNDYTSDEYKTNFSSVFEAVKHVSMELYDWLEISCLVKCSCGFIKYDIAKFVGGEGEIIYVENTTLFGCIFENLTYYSWKIIDMILNYFKS